MTYTYRKGLPELPAKMRGLKIEERGYPVPWFVEWIDGKPDFRVIDSEKFFQAIRYGDCWLCGGRLGKFKTFVVGPMCVVNRTTSEPPCHLECARYAATACPFMILPTAKRRDANMPDHQPIAGQHLDRNPGATCLYTTLTFSPFKTEDLHPGAKAGILITMGEPRSVEWYAEGALCARGPVQESIDSGMHYLWAMARAQSINSMVLLENYYHRAMALLPS